LINVFVVEEDKLDQANDYLKMMLERAKTVTANEIRLPKVEKSRIDCEENKFSVTFIFVDGGGAILEAKYAKYIDESIIIITGDSSYDELIIYSE
jgi:hypothetical protein